MDLKEVTGSSTPLDVDPTALRGLGIDLESAADQLRSAMPSIAHLRASPTGWAVTQALTGWTDATTARLRAVADSLDSAGSGMRTAAVGYAETDAGLRMPDPAGAWRGAR